MSGPSSNVFARNSVMSTQISTTSTTTRVSATAGLPAASPAAAGVVAPEDSQAEEVAREEGKARRRLPPFYRSLSAKAAVLTLIFLAVPLIIYDQFEAADTAQKELLLRSVREQGRVMSQALLPQFAGLERPSLPQLGRELARFADAFTNVKLLFGPVGKGGFFYVASWPAVSAAQLETERDKLMAQGVLDRLSATCAGEIPVAFRYQTPGGDDEIVTSLTPIRTPAGCWALVTSFSATSMPGATVGRPYWESPEVRLAAAIYLIMVLLTFTTFWSIRRGLRRFADRARAIHEHRPGEGSFSARNDVPELAEAAGEFDHMVEVLNASARDIRRAAEDNAHAFKTPIAVIRQSLEPLRRALPQDHPRGLRAIGLIESSLDRLDGIVASARRLDEATADVIDTVRTEVDLSSLLERLLQAHDDVLARRGLTLKGHIAPRVIVLANEEMVETVIENLFDNALSFSPPGESIGVRLEMQGSMARLIIGDCGPGVAAENLERIFDRYFSNRPTHSPTGDDPSTHFGIGLWIARRNVEAMGGTIEAENRRPTGLLMRVTLKLAELPRG